jgi:hypothetical protein
MNIISKTRHAYQINVREYRRDNKKWTIQRNRQHRVDRTKKQATQGRQDEETGNTG